MGGSLSACTNKGSACMENNTRASLKPGKRYTFRKRHSEKPDQEPQVHIWSIPERLEKGKQYCGTVLRQNTARDQVDAAELIAVKKDIEHYLTWLNQCGYMFRDEHSPKLSKSQVALRLEDLKTLTDELMLKQDDLVTISNNAKDLAKGHPCTEQIYIEETLGVAWKQHTELLNAVSYKCHALEKLAQQHRHFDKRLQMLKRRFKKEFNAANYFDSIRLSACEVDQQLERCKSMFAEIQSEAQEVHQIRMMADSLKQTCNNCGQEELETAVWELTNQHEQLLQRLKQQRDNLCNLLTSRRKFESDSHTIDRWCQDTAMQCVRALSLKCTAEDLEQQYKICKNLYNSAPVLRSLFEETKELAESYFPSLLLTEQPLLTRHIGSLHYKLIRVSNQVHKQLQTLEDALRDRWSTHEQSTLSEHWLHTDRKHSSTSDARHSLNIHQNIHKNTSHNESEHTATKVSIGKLDQVYESFDTMVQIEGVNQTGATTERKKERKEEDVEIEDANKKMKDFEKEVNELLKWVEHTRTRMTMRDTTTALREQLEVQQICQNAANLELCVLSPDLFNLYSEVIMRSIQDMPEISVGRHTVNNVHYTNDMVLVAESEMQLQEIIDIIVSETENRGNALQEIIDIIVTESENRGNAVTRYDRYT